METNSGETDIGTKDGSIEIVQYSKDMHLEQPPDNFPSMKSNAETQFSSHDQSENLWNRLIWHGGSVYDAWLNAVSAQVGQVILSMPYSFSQMGYGFGVFFQAFYALIGCWTCYLLACLYLEYRSRKEKEGANFKRHVIQYHEVLGYLVGSWAKYISLFFNILCMGAVAVVQIIACASNAYYLSNRLDKRQWALVFGGVSTLTVLLPSIQNFRVWSLMGVITTTYTAWYMLIASLVHGQVPNVKHSAPNNLEKFFTGTTNILFAFGGHSITIEIMHAMWKPEKYKYVYLLNCLYVLTITMPNSVAVYWAYGDELLHNSNAFAVLPKSTFRSIGLVFMIVHQAVAFGLYIMPLNFMWEKLLGVHQSVYMLRVIARVPVALTLWFLALMLPFFGPLNSLIGSFIMSFSVYIIPCVAYLITFNTKKSREESAAKHGVWIPRPRGIIFINIIIIIVIFILGFGFGSWASISNIVKQIHTFGIFDKCYQCS